MKNKKETYKRHLELSSKIMKMGEALRDEGLSKNDNTIIQTGHFMILISGLVLVEKDLNSFVDICSMFSSRSILIHLENTNPLILDKLRDQALHQTYSEELMKDDEDEDEDPLN